jgi:dUTP pyrophosphatase
VRLRDVPVPLRATAGSAGFDLHAAGAASIPARGFGAIDTGIALQLPAGFEAQVRPRSGLAARHGIGVLNSPGTIDCDYRGEVKVILFNISSRDFVVQPGDRIAQLVISRTCRTRLREVAKLGVTKRGSGGFGHTG